jgi:hypothetical protein
VYVLKHGCKRLFASSQVLASYFWLSGTEYPDFGVVKVLPASAVADIPSGEDMPLQVLDAADREKIEGERARALQLKSAYDAATAEAATEEQRKADTAAAAEAKENATTASAAQAEEAVAAAAVKAQKKAAASEVEKQFKAAADDEQMRVIAAAAAEAEEAVALAAAEEQRKATAAATHSASPVEPGPSAGLEVQKVEDHMLVSIFMHLDVNKSSTISSRELCAGIVDHPELAACLNLRAMGMDDDDEREEIDDWVSKQNLDMDGEISRTEFLEFFHKKGVMSEEARGHWGSATAASSLALAKHSSSVVA